MTILSDASSESPKSREYCFVIMSYKECYNTLYEQVRTLIEQHIKIRCVRADREPQPGRDLLGKVHEMILGASVVIADVTEHSPNVYYEYGYATAHDRRPILFLREGSAPPTDLVGKEALRYRGTPSEDKQFTEQLLECILRELRSPLPEQRRMLTSPQPFPAYVIAAPRVPGVGSKHWWHPDERNTFGDNFGITGILTAYGNLFGTRQIPELLHAQFIPHDLLDKPGNFFCLGSSKVNPVSEEFLERVQSGCSLKWKMIEVGDGVDKRVVFQGDPKLDQMLAAPVKQDDDGSVCDYGLIVRAPYPGHPQYLVLIAAGRHSIGTHAACRMVTQQKLIAELEHELDKEIGITLRDTTQPFWAVVSGRLQKDGAMHEDVGIEKVGTYAQH